MIYFISDVHLGHEPRALDRIREDMLLAFLKKIEKDCATLFIVGDLFDYWFEYKMVVPRAFTRTLAALYSLRKSGATVEYLMGNHDFGHHRYFEDELGIPIIKNDVERTIAGKRFYISHGDGKLNNDLGYKILKATLRNPVSNRLYRLIHPDLGAKIALAFSKISRKHSSAKNYGTNDGMKDFAKMKLAEGLDYVVMGHIHKAMEIKFSGGAYVNLGAWFKAPRYARFDGTELTLESVESLLGAGE